MTEDDGKHECPYPPCGRRLDRAILACRAHWFLLPKGLRDDVNRRWRQLLAGRCSPDEYLTARNAATDWLERHYAESPRRTPT